MLETWLSRSKEISSRLADGERLIDAWEVVLRFIWENNFVGACHDTSAVLFILLSELGLLPTLNIGEVKATAGVFDHSWVEVDGLIFDAAVCLPQDEEVEVSGPVFASIDLTTKCINGLVYGVNSGQGLGSDALPAATLDLSGFASIQPHLNIWVLSVGLAGRIGLDLTFAGVEKKYGKVTRNLVNISQLTEQ